MAHRRKGKRAFRACIRHKLQGRHFKGVRSQRRALGRASRACARKAF